MRSAWSSASPPPTRSSAATSAALPSIIAVIMNYVRRSATVGTFLESHFRWQIRTFWFACCGPCPHPVVAVPLVLTIIGIPLVFLGLVCPEHLDCLPRSARLARAARPAADVRMRPAHLLLGVVLLLAACGQKGPLYLPDQKPPWSRLLRNQPRRPPVQPRILRLQRRRRTKTPARPRRRNNPAAQAWPWGPRFGTPQHDVSARRCTQPSAHRPDQAACKPHRAHRASESTDVSGTFTTLHSSHRNGLPNGY